MGEWFREFFTERYAEVGFEPKLGSTTEAETDAVVDLAELTADSLVLDVPCGIGRHCIALGKRGHRTVGIDLNDRYIEIAKAQTSEAGIADDRCSYRIGDMRAIDTALQGEHVGQFDAAINLFSSLGYFESSQDDVSVLKSLRFALKPQGVVIIDTQCKETIDRQFQPIGAFRVGEHLIVEEREYDLFNNIVTARWTFVKDSRVVQEQITKVRLYTIKEWRAMLVEAGFVNVEAFRGLEPDPKPFSPSEPGRLVLRARTPSAV